jgi:UDP-2-acetamido-3-amino-2,3-dideoxy-glucuronate N-acetyltransferase
MKITCSAGRRWCFTNVINPRSQIERKSEFKPTLIKRGATLGANSTVLCGHAVGRYAFIAAGAVVTRDVPDYALVQGVPGRIFGWMCRCGLKLAFPENDLPSQIIRCAGCGIAYVKCGEKVEERVLV